MSAIRNMLLVSDFSNSLFLALVLDEDMCLLLLFIVVQAECDSRCGICDSDEHCVLLRVTVGNQ